MTDLNGLENFAKAGAAAGITLDEVARHLQAILGGLPPMAPGETEALIRMNPSLSRFQRWRLIRWLRRTKKRGKGIDTAPSI